MEKEYIILKFASEIAKIKGISLLEAMRLPDSEFWDAGITI